LAAGVDVNISTVSEEISNVVIAACSSHLLQENSQVLRLSWRDACMNQLKTTLIVVISSDVTHKTSYSNSLAVALDLTLAPAS